MSQNEQTPDFMWANRFGQFYNTMNGYDEAMAGGTQVYDTDDTLPLSGMLDDEEDDSLKQSDDDTTQPNPSNDFDLRQEIDVIKWKLDAVVVLNFHNLDREVHQIKSVVEKVEKNVEALQSMLMDVLHHEAEAMQRITRVTESMKAKEESTC